MDFNLVSNSGKLTTSNSKDGAETKGEDETVWFHFDNGETGFIKKSMQGISLILDNYWIYTFHSSIKLSADNKPCLSSLYVTTVPTVYPTLCHVYCITMVYLLGPCTNVIPLHLWGITTKIYKNEYCHHTICSVWPTAQPLPSFVAVVAWPSSQ